MSDNESKYCTTCGTTAVPINHSHGSFAGEVAVWIIAIIIGAASSYIILIAPFAYSVYRTISKSKVCPKCLSSSIIPADSPAAKSAGH